MKGSVRGGLQGLGLALACVRLYANDFFVAPGGTSSGPGTVSQPYDLVSAFSGQVGQPGDTFWLRGGNYLLGHLDTSVHGAPGRPVTFRGVTGENVRIDGSLSIFNSNGYVCFRNFELYSSDLYRVSSETNVGFNPTDITILPGFSSYVPNVTFMNLAVHDQTRHGIYLFEGATNTLVYGCVLFNNGWVSPDNAEGHGLYAQANVGSRTLADNIIFNNSGANMHVYDSTAGAILRGVVVDGNVAFNAGAIQSVRPYRDWIIGVDAPALYADGIVLENNMGVPPPPLSPFPEIQVGRDGTNGTVVFTNNYMPLGLLMNNWHSATVTGNLFAPKSTNYVVNLNQTLTSLNADWDNNIYVFDPAGPAISVNSTPYVFSEWQELTGFDWDSTFVVGDLHGTKVFVRPNRYEPGRANIVVYNWDNLDNVAVDVNSVLPLNSTFEVRNAQNFFGPSVLSGTFSGQRLSLPMTNLTVALVNGPINGPLVTPAPTGPGFNVFVLLPVRPPIQVRLAGGSVQVLWNLSFGPNALETTQTPETPGTWTASTSSPGIIGDQFMISEPTSANRKFYRLQTQ